MPEEPHAGNTAWIVDPQVHAHFQNRAALEEQRRRAWRDILLAGSEEAENYPLARAISIVSIVTIETLGSPPIETIEIACET